MVSDALNKNMLLKTKLLKKRFGLFKSVVTRNKQLTYFLRNSQKKISEINYLSSDDKIPKIKILLDYFYDNKDIWSGNKILYDSFEQKTVSVASMMPNVFNDYLLLFGYNCPYPKSDGSICFEHVSSDRLCDCHREIIPRVKSEILSGLTTFPKDICDIVFKFTMCYKQH